MAYSYYRQAGHPGWGTNQFQFGPPPVPSFQPQPSWGGMDFFRAHAPSSDLSMFDHAWSRLREPSAALAGAPVSVGLHEARHWHRRAYGGLGQLEQMLPVEIGHAAAYEAYRTWIHNSSLHEPLSGDFDRQREGLVGLAVAEALRLLQYSPNGAAAYARLTASETAAATASVIFYQSREDPESYRSRSRSRRGSYDGYNEPYEFDDALRPYRRHSRSRSRHRTLSSSQPQLQITYPTSAVSIPGQALSYQGQPGSYGAYGVGSGSYGSYGSHMPMHGVNNQYAAPAAMGMSNSYHGSIVGTPYPSHGMALSAPLGHARSRSSSMSYPQQQNMQYMPSAGGMTVSTLPSALPQTQTIVIHKPHKKHRHRSKHRRSRSIEPQYYGASPRY